MFVVVVAVAVAVVVVAAVVVGGGGFACPMHSTEKFATTVLSKCVCVCCGEQMACLMRILKEGTCANVAITHSGKGRKRQRQVI